MSVLDVVGRYYEAWMAGKGDFSAVPLAPDFSFTGPVASFDTALHMAKWASHVTILVRAESLADSMSDYLIREIDATPNVDVCYRVQVADGTGAGQLESLVLQDTASKARRSVPADALFVLIGSQPRTEWLGDSVARDQWGFILTGPDLLGGSSRRWPPGRPPLPLETSLPGVFAAGDVRQGSVKRVASAVGEGAATIPLVHRYLQTAAAPAAAVRKTLSLASAPATGTQSAAR